MVVEHGELPLRVVEIWEKWNLRMSSTFAELKFRRAQPRNAAI